MMNLYFLNCNKNLLEMRQYGVKVTSAIVYQSGLVDLGIAFDSILPMRIVTSLVVILYVLHQIVHKHLEILIIKNLENYI